MKRIIIVIVVLFASFQIKGQKDNYLNEMASSSISSYITWKNDFIKSGISQHATCLHYICKDGLPTGFPYDSVKNVVFFSLENMNGLPKSFQKELKKGISAYFVKIKLSGKQLIIMVEDSGVKLTNKNHIGISVVNWCVFTYEYSCEKQKWFFIKNEYGGV